MTRSDNTVLDRLSASASRYDLVLALVPSAFVASLLVAHLLSIPSRTAIAAASVVGALALVDALFLNPPRRPPTRDPGAVR